MLNTTTARRRSFNDTCLHLERVKEASEGKIETVAASLLYCYPRLMLSQAAEQLIEEAPDMLEIVKVIADAWNGENYISGIKWTVNQMVKEG